MIEYMFIRPHHTMKFIYLRCTVVFTYGVYKYTTVDINTPYKRFKSILWWFLLFIYMILSTDFYICICRYMSTVFYICIYTYISHPFFICIYVYILIYIFVFSRHYILTARVFALPPAECCKSRTFVHFNTFKIFHLIENFSKLKYIENPATNRIFSISSKTLDD